MLILAPIRSTTSTRLSEASVFFWLDIDVEKIVSNCDEFCRLNRRWHTIGAKRSFLQARWANEIYSPQGFAEEKMESINEGKCHHMPFSIRLLKIYLILIWANARNTMSHWLRVSYDSLDVLRSTVLCFYSAVSVHIQGQVQKQGNFKSLCTFRSIHEVHCYPSTLPFSSWKCS